MLLSKYHRHGDSYRRRECRHYARHSEGLHMRACARPVLLGGCAANPQIAAPRHQPTPSKGRTPAPPTALPVPPPPAQVTLSVSATKESATAARDDAAVVSPALSACSAPLPVLLSCCGHTADRGLLPPQAAAERGASRLLAPLTPPTRLRPVAPQAAAKVVGELQKVVPKEDITTLDFSVSPQYSYPVGGAPVITGYQASQRIQVRVVGGVFQVAA